MSDGHLPPTLPPGESPVPGEADRAGQTRSALAGVRRIASRLRPRQQGPSPGSAPVPAREAVPYPLAEWEQEILQESLPYTMTSPARLVATIDAVAYACQNAIPGALAECGVWRGGSVLAMIRTLQHHGVRDRDVYLFDTFEGMTRPGEQDTSMYDAPALETWKVSEQTGEIPWRWAFDPQVFDFESLQSLMAATGYPAELIHFVKGRVEETIPTEAPGSIAVLRLDTDWYESTRHELVHLYPRVVRSGVLIIDDYGHWDGCRKAVDEYFQASADPMFLARTDYTGRIGIKIG